MEVQRARIAAIAGLCGASVAQDKAYPGWAPNPSSPVLQVLHLVFMIWGLKPESSHKQIKPYTARSVVQLPPARCHAKGLLLPIHCTRLHNENASLCATGLDS